MHWINIRFELLIQIEFRHELWKKKWQQMHVWSFLLGLFALNAQIHLCDSKLYNFLCEKSKMGCNWIVFSNSIHINGCWIWILNVFSLACHTHIHATDEISQIVAWHIYKFILFKIISNLTLKFRYYMQFIVICGETSEMCRFTWWIQKCRNPLNW